MNDRLRFLWLSIAANIVLLACLTWGIIKPLIRPSPGSYAAAELQMKLGYEKGPILLLLDKEFDKNASFKLFDRDQELMIVREDEENGVKSVAIVLGTDAELALECYYVYGPKPSFRVFQLTMGDRILEDLNADGQYDLRTWMPSASSNGGHPAIDVWFNNEWQEVIGGAGENYRSVNTLKDDLRVSFDRTSGRWVPLTPSDQK